MISKYVMSNWLFKSAFKNQVANGLIKTYYLDQNPNAVQNLNLIELIINKLFTFDHIRFEDDLLQRFSTLTDLKKNVIL